MAITCILNVVFMVRSYYVILKNVACMGIISFTSYSRLIASPYDITVDDVAIESKEGVLDLGHRAASFVVEM